MSQTFKKNHVLLAVISLGLVLMAGPQSAASQEPASIYYEAVDLVSNVPGQTNNTDFLLIDPWGLSIDAGGWWVANKGSGRVTYYNSSGVPWPALAPTAIIVPVSPSGVYEYSTPGTVTVNDTNDFELAPGIPAKLLIATGEGTVAGWNGSANEYNAVLGVDNSPGAMYTGAAITLTNGNLLYVANFRQGRIEAYATNFSAVQLGENAFVDPLIPAGFSPYNIQTSKGLLYVTYAEPGGDGNAVPGEGLGYVDAFDPEGKLVLRFKQGPWMNGPWGVALAPLGFGDFSGRLLVGNTGSGRIASFDPLTGEFLGYLPDRSGSPLVIKGLHGLAFGSTGIAGRTATLFFTAGLDVGRNSTMGVISVYTRGK